MDIKIKVSMWVEIKDKKDHELWSITLTQDDLIECAERQLQNMGNDQIVDAYGPELSVILK